MGKCSKDPDRLTPNDDVPGGVSGCGGVEIMEGGCRSGSKNVFFISASSFTYLQFVSNV